MTIQHYFMIATDFPFPTPPIDETISSIDLRVSAQGKSRDKAEAKNKKFESFSLEIISKEPR